MYATATLLLERNVEAINALNVFPVPDGDTGTNMYLTLREVMEKTGPLRGSSSAEVSEAMARAALMGARGNSGVILSQFFKGMAVGLEGASEFGAEELVRAYREARQHSYRAVADPVEGTILTVISSVAEAAQESLASQGTVQDISEAVCVAARDAVARTPTMLAVLREAGVVDAGGQGLAVMLEGVRRYVMGEVTDPLEIAPPEPIGVEHGMGAVSADFLAATEEELYGYCTQFMIQGRELDADSIRDGMDAMARSTVVVGDQAMVKVHVHTDDPGAILRVGVSQGVLSQISIQNMDEQRVGFSAARRKEASAAQVAVVAVAQGKGLEALFANLGASGHITGGDTMNPSVKEMVEAVESASSDNVIILPNNGNIVPAAAQAAEYSQKTVRVVPTRSIPQGVAAILSFNPERGLDSNVSAMEEAQASVRTGEVTVAVRSATLNGVAVEPGRLIGLLERELVVAGDDLSQVVLSILSKAQVSDGDLVTLYWGEQMTADDANVVSQRVTAAFSGVEIEIVEGGQPHYHLILSIE
jgi:DAK2 domain fusion protein YloV